MSRHRREEQTSLKRPMAILIAVLVAALAIFGVVQALGGDEPSDGDDASTQQSGSGAGDDEATGDDVGADGAGTTADDADANGSDAEAVTGGAADAACEATHEVTVLASPEIAPVVKDVTESQVECTTYTVVSQPPLEVAASFASGTAPDAQVWIPSSPAFADAVSEAGAALETGPVVATSPVVLAAEQSVFDEVAGSLAEEPTWADLVTAEVPLVVGDPAQDPATLATLLAAQAGLGDSDAAQVLTQNLMVDLAQNATADPAGAVATGLPIFVPSTAAQVAASADSDVALAGLTPRGGAGALSYPFVVLPGAAGEPGVAELQEALLGADAAATFESGGFTAGDSGATPTDEAAVAALTEQWGALNPPSRLLAIIDVSGSMDEQVGDTTRIAITSQAAGMGLGMFPDDSAVGLWAFSTDRGPGGEDYAEILPVRPLTQDVDGQTQRELLEEASAGLTEDFTTGDTGLHDTILAAYLHMQQDWEPGYVSSIVLLTDGVNDDSTGGLSEAELIAELEDAADPEREVRLILIGMGPDVDSAALDRVATAVGGQSFTAEDPRDIGQVFVQAIAARHG
ncbi:substrate-binding and VWA domain-containing protein [Ornithinimicrobium faecis]|uniref:substrate-binding and VWA domain-containing protein n=1 Tax=Ornithinimicrobium faecis TaxID=2934158 RepID=UPI002118FB2D|nr:substrate-binding and VWA domain-containing protein [Ornithinimicrobium sp. HY1745]